MKKDEEMTDRTEKIHKIHTIKANNPTKSETYLFGGFCRGWTPGPMSPLDSNITVGARWPG